MTSNIYLNSIGQNINTFKGVYSCNNIPHLNTTSEMCCFIVNQSEVDQKGSHFIAMILNKQSVYYFDPYGVMCSNIHILKYMQHYCKSYYFNKIQIQSIDSIYCGLFCLGIVIEFNRGGSIKSFIKHFISNLTKNDNIIVNYIMNNIPK